MSVAVFPSAAACREHLRNAGYRQVSYVTSGKPEYWWNGDTASAAEVARSKIYVFDRFMSGYQDVVDIINKPRTPYQMIHYGYPEKPLPYTPGADIYRTDNLARARQIVAMNKATAP